MLLIEQVMDYYDKDIEDNEDTEDNEDNKDEDIEYVEPKKVIVEEIVEPQTITGGNGVYVQKPFVCPKCGNKFGYPHTLKYHIANNCRVGGCLKK